MSSRKKADKANGEPAAGAEGLNCEVSPISYAPPAALSQRVRNLACDACEARGYRWLAMSSGAGHDAQTMARVCDAGLIFVPSVGGRSHRPDENTAIADAAKGVQVIAGTALHLCLQGAGGA